VLDDQLAPAAEQVRQGDRRVRLVEDAVLPDPDLGQPD
jgi:hypothetical protein